MDSSQDFFGRSLSEAASSRKPGSHPNDSNADKANDITFGDIGDIRAGDNASEQQWAPDHDALAKAIEAEKEAILRRLHEDQKHSRSPRSSPLSSSPPHHGPVPHSFPAQLPPNTQPPPHLRQQSHQRPLASSPPTHQHPLFAQQPAHPSTSMLAQHYPMLQQQRQDPRLVASSLPGRHALPNRAPMQQPPRMYAAPQQPQHLQPPPQRQPMSQNTQIEVHMLVRAQQQRFADQNRHLRPDQIRQLLVQHHQQIVAQAIARVQAAHAAHLRMPLRPAPSGNTQEYAAPAAPAPIPKAASSSMPPLPTDALSVSELESRMRSTRIAKPVKRQLPPMTDKDLELVLRMHLRQLDMANPYRDDFYAVLYRQHHGADDDQSTAQSAFDMYEQLGARLEELTESGVIGGEDRSRRKRGRSKKNTTGREPVGAQPGRHTSSNLKTLTLALGTIQSWTPRAPRRLMDLSTVASASVKSVAKRNAIGDEPEAEMRLMREDERVRVRAAIEDGYDIMSLLQDVVRKRAAHDADVLLGRLVGTLRLSLDKRDEDAFASFETMRVFVRMCRFAKGILYLTRVLSVLPAHHAARVLGAVFENLHALLFTIAPVAHCAPDALWSALIVAVERPSFAPYRCLDLLNVFCRSHAHDSGALVIVLSSAVGAKLLYVSMQRLFSAQNEDPTLRLTVGNAEWDTLCGAITARLGDVFDTCESSKNVWEVAAMLDSLSEGASQETLRTTLKDLLDSGRAPPPPGT